MSFSAHRRRVLLAAFVTLALLALAGAVGAATTPAPTPSVAKPAAATTATTAAKPAAATTATATAAAKPASPTSATSGARPARAHAKASAPAATEHAHAPAPIANADTSMTLRGGDDGTVFKSLTVEGEDRIHVEISRPDLALDVDPQTAPGLEGGDARDVLTRTSPDPAAPLLAVSARETSPYEGTPWLDRFASGGVARFHPQVKGVVWWRLTVADARGETAMSWEGQGEPPAEIAWDGRSKSGAPVMPGLTYSYVLEARDKAGNRRHFVGDGFRVPAFRYDSAQGPLLVFAGHELDADASSQQAMPGASAPAPAVLVEAAGALTQAGRIADPVRVTATARTAGQAQALAERVRASLAVLLPGDPARVRTAAETLPGAPEDGAIRIELGR